jgi:FKBP-type peptidyl-prolyl cis-trans isomerase SlyD
MTIEANKVVSLHYRLQIGDSDGELVEETFGSEPLTFLFGTGQMIPDFEKNLEGKKAGDEFAFGIESKSAYGEFNPEAVVVLPMDTFMVDGKLAEEFLETGKTIPMSDQDGHRMNGVVKEVKENGVEVDFNHPMAGQDLYFTGKVETLRAATAGELEHGHVHGEGGHQH